jgi:hypothetical protein
MTTALQATLRSYAARQRRSWCPLLSPSVALPWVWTVLERTMIDRDKGMGGGSAVGRVHSW